MKIFLILTLSLCAVQCSDVLVKVIQEAYIGSCRFGCNHCQPFDDDIDNNNNNSTTTTSDPIGYYQQKLEVALQEKKALEEEVEKATTAESSITNAGNTTQDLVDAATGNTTRRHRRKRASETVTLTSCADPSSTINGTVTQVILLVLQGIQSSLAAISTDNLDTTTLDCYISLALSLKTDLVGGALAKPSDVTQITTVAVSIQTSVVSVKVVVVVYRTEKSKELVIKIQEVEEAKEEVINAGGTVTEVTMTSTAAPNTTTTITANSSSSVSTVNVTSINNNTSTPPITRLYCDDDCGRSVITVPRIVGGQEATTHEYPWQVHLSITADAFTSPGQCGASIIKRSWLLTAAHCLVDPDTSELYSNINVLATLAEHDLNNETETQRIRIFPSFVFVHPEYKKGPDASSEEHDIALLFIDGTLTFGSTLKPLCMPQPEDYVADKGVIATGWGVTSFQGDSSNVLREVSLTLKSQEECKTLNENAPETYIVTDNMICTLGEDKDACQGDSGGPLITRSADGRWIQLGIVSFGYKCAEPNVPGFYTNLANYVDWITNVTLSSNC